MAPYSQHNLQHTELLHYEAPEQGRPPTAAPDWLEECEYLVQFVSAEMQLSPHAARSMYKSLLRSYSAHGQARDM